jgi:hypothetical protein
VIEFNGSLSTPKENHWNKDKYFSIFLQVFFFFFWEFIVHMLPMIELDFC